MLCPFTLLVDSREQMPFHFHGFESVDPDGRTVPLVVPTKRVGLVTGDYSIEGFDERVAVERKSLEDLYGTLADGRDRFENEFNRLMCMDYAALVIEAPMGRTLGAPPDGRRLNPESIFGTAVSWQQKYPRVHWWFCESRHMAEVATFRILRTFHERRVAGELGPR